MAAVLRPAAIGCAAAELLEVSMHERHPIRLRQVRRSGDPRVLLFPLLFGAIAALATTPCTAAFEVEIPIYAEVAQGSGDDPEDFGRAVSLDGSQMLIGSVDRADFFDETGVGEWTLVAQFEEPSINGGVFLFGSSVALSGDWALVGAPYSTVGGFNHAGLVRVYHRQGGVWSLAQTLQAPTPATDKVFGFSLTLQDDTALIGAAGLQDVPGEAHFFYLSGGLWNPQGSVQPDPPAIGKLQFGTSVALDGDLAFVGAPLAYSGALANAGAAYVCERAGGNWDLRSDPLWAPVPQAQATFGCSVAVDGETVLVGEKGRGRAYLYQQVVRDWTLLQELAPSDDPTPVGFGLAVSLEGTRALVSGVFSDPNWSGSVYLYERQPPGAEWTETLKLVPQDISSGAFFGYWVSLDGGRALIGAPNQNGLLGIYEGKAYLYQGGGVVSGRVYLDDDMSPCSDSPVGVPGRWVRFVPEETGVEWLVSTGSDGTYSIGLPAGSYTANLEPAQYWSQSCPSPPGEYVVDSPFGASGIDFGTASTDGVWDLTVQVLPSRAPRPGFSLSYALTCENIGTMAQAASVDLQLPDEVSFESASDGGVHSEGTVHWDTTLLPGQVTEISATVHVGTEVALGTILHAAAHIGPDGEDADPGNNSDVDDSEVVGSYDPNDKAVLPEGDIPVDQPLTYRIRFQNVGTAEAIDIVVRDTLDSQLDMTTLDITAASHPFDLEIAGREIIWRFPNIDLPDSTSDEPGSHGSVEFVALPRSTLEPGAVIQNRAGIYFDFNPVVLTNTVASTISGPAAVGEESERPWSLGPVRVSPNPGPGGATVVFQLPETGRLVAKVFSVDGRWVQTLFDEPAGAGPQELHWDGRDSDGAAVPGGIYFLRLWLEAEARTRVDGAQIVVLRR